MAVSVNVPEHLRPKKREVPDPNKRKGWSTPHGFLDFTHPVTYEDACKQGEQLAEFAAKLWDKHKEKKDV